MARTAPRLAGRLLNSSGAGISGATVHVYDAGTTTPSRADVATGSDGSWAIGPAESGDAALTGRGAFDVQLNDGTTKLRIVQNTEAQFKSIELVNVDSGEAPLLVAQMNDGASVPVAIFEGDRSTDALGSSGSETDEDEAYISFRLANDADEQTEMVRLNWTASDVSNASEDGRLEFEIMVSGSMVDKLQLDGTALSPMASDGLALGTAALEWSDLFLADAAVISFGDDQEVTLTHVHDTGILLSSTDQLQFGDSGTYIHQSADGVLDLVSDTEIEINATTIDLNGAVAMDGAITGATNITLSGELDAATLDLSSSADIAGDLVLSGGADGALQFSNAGENSIKIPDNQASALIIEEADNAYITFVTTNSSEAITVAKATTFSAGIADAGTIAAGTWNGTDVGVAYGGTGASTLTDGGVLLGSGTGAITAMSVLADSEMIVGDGSTDPVAESGATLRTSIGVGTGNSPQFTDLTLTNDLLLAEGSIINWDSSDFTITQTGNTLNFAGGDLHTADGTGVVIGHTAQIAIGGATHEFQVLGTASATDAGAGHGIWGNNSDGFEFHFGKSRAAAIGGAAVTGNNGDTIAQLIFDGDDGADMATRVASLAIDVDGTVASDQLPGRFIFRTANSSGSNTEALRIDSAQDITLASLPSGAVTNIGHSSNVITIDSSSREYKRNEQSARNTDRIYSLAPKDFVWDENSATAGRAETGLIAEDVYAVIPEAVVVYKDRVHKMTTNARTGEKTGEYVETGEVKPQAIRMPVLMAMVIDQMKQLKASVDKLEAA